MNGRLTLWLPVGMLLLLAALTFWLERMVQPPPQKRDGSTRHDPDYSVENFSAIRMGEDGTPRHSLAATVMVHYPDDDSTHLARPHFTRYEKSIPSMHILAQQGLISSDGENAYFMDGVQVIREAKGSLSQLTLNTSYLHIIPDQDFAKTDRPVVVQDAYGVVTAVGMELNNRTGVVKLLSNVKGQYEKAKR